MLDDTLHDLVRLARRLLVLLGVAATAAVIVGVVVAVG